MTRAIAAAPLSGENIIVEFATAKDQLEPHVTDFSRHADLLAAIEPIVIAAGRVIMQIYGSDFDVQRKNDDSPVTDADEKAESLITAALQRISPDLPIIAEEAVAAGRIPDEGDRFWLVDPLDGTREFIKRNGEFTVNVALIERGEPVIGIVHAPALGQLYAGQAGAGAYLHDSNGRRPISVRTPPAQGLTVVASRSHGNPAALDAFLAGRRVAASMTAGSSLKLCLVACGQADLYPRLGRTMEWDVAAGHAVLAAAGGRVTDIDGAELRYGKPGFENPHFVAWGADE